MKRRTIILSGIFLGLIVCALITTSTARFVLAQGQIVTSKELTEADAKNAASRLTLRTLGPGTEYSLKHFNPRYRFKADSIEVIGIFQEGNKATVYSQFRTFDDRQFIGTIQLIRFTSGKWFCPYDKEFVTK